MSDEQRVRTMAGWIGVEISKSRVRTAGRDGYGLYRVRGTTVRIVDRDLELLSATAQIVPLEWTAYAFSLDEIEVEIRAVIRKGMPSGPLPLVLMPAGSMRNEDAVTVPTRWTSTYQGKRDLGVGPFVRRFVGDGLANGTTTKACGLLLAAVLDAMSETERRGWLHDSSFIGRPVTSRRRQREANAAFQREHLERRAYGLERRHEAKAQRNGTQLRT